jgi:hypothetical protein
MPRTMLRPGIRGLMLAGMVALGVTGCVVVPARGRIVGPPFPVLVPPVVVAPRPVPVPRRAYGYDRQGYDRYGYDRHGYDRYGYGYRRW